MLDISDLRLITMYLKTIICGKLKKIREAMLLGFIVNGLDLYDGYNIYHPYYCLFLRAS